MSHTKMDKSCLYKKKHKCCIKRNPILVVNHPPSQTNVRCKFHRIIGYWLELAHGYETDIFVYYFVDCVPIIEKQRKT